MCENSTKDLIELREHHKSVCELKDMDLRERERRIKTLYIACEELKDKNKSLIQELEQYKAHYAKSLQDAERLYDIRRTMFRVGNNLELYEQGEDEIIRIGKWLVAESEICPSCQGDGIEGDEEGYGPCERCSGSTLVQNK